MRLRVLRIVSIAFMLHTLLASAVSQNAKEGSPATFSCDSARNAVETYQSWIDQLKKHPFSGALNDQHVARLTITIIRGADEVPDAKMASLLGCDYLGTRTTFAVSTEGTVSMSRFTAGAIQGGGPSLLPRKDFEELLRLAANLPSDSAHLPPRGRLVIVSGVGQEANSVHIYDRANLPDSILEMLRLVGADVWPILDFPDLQPDARWSTSELASLELPQAAVAFRNSDQRILASDNKRNLVALEVNPSQFFDSTVHVERVGTLKEKPYDSASDTVLRILNTGSGAVVHEFHEPMQGRTYVYVYAARFTPDGQQLLVQSSKPDVRIYSTSTWQLVSSSTAIPAGVVAYYPTQDWKHGVAAFPSGEINLVDEVTGHKLARIDSGGELQSAVFSNDDSQVAVVTEDTNSTTGYSAHLRVWATNSGALLHEFRPLEATPRDAFGEPIWLPGDKYIIAPTREGHSGLSVVGVWSVTTGRYQGALAGCTQLDAPWTVFLLDADKLYKKCSDGEVLTWDLKKDIQKLAEFEDSLGNAVR